MKIEALQVDLSTYEGVEILYEYMKNSSTPVYALAMNAGFDREFNLSYSHSVL